MEARFIGQQSSLFLSLSLARSKFNKPINFETKSRFSLPSNGTFRNVTGSVINLAIDDADKTIAGKCV
jgi:hypothetical protein